MTSETSSTPLQLINERQRFDEELERAKVRRIINGPNSKERISLLVELTLNDHFSRQVGADSTRASIILNRQGDPRIVQHSGLGANDLVIIDLTEVAERIQFEIGLNGPKSLDDQIITLMKDVIIEEFNRQSLEFSLLPDRA